MERNPYIVVLGAHARRLLSLILLSGLCTAGSSRPALGADASAPLQLSLKEAIELALVNNADMAIAQLKIEEIEGVARTVKAGLWPQVSVYATERRQQRSTEAFGFSDDVGFVSQISAGGAGTELRFETEPDEVIGPFNVAEATLRAGMPLLDLETWNLRQAANAGLHLADLQRSAVRDDVLTQTATLYLSVLVKEEASRALSQKVDLRERRLKLIEDESSAGTATDYDVKRDRLLLATARNELLRTRQELEAAKRSLCRLIGCEPSGQIALTELLQVQQLSLPERDAAVDLALFARPDYLAGRQSVVVASHHRDAAKGKRWPRADLFGSYGKQGESFDGSVDAWGVGVGVTMSVWDAGKLSGELQQKESALAQIVMRQDALRTRVRDEVHAAFDDLAYRTQSLEVAQQTVELAREKLRQEEDRRRTGSTTHLSVVEAMVAVVEAELKQKEAVFNHNLARIAGYKATGQALQIVPGIASGDPGPDTHADEPDHGRQ